MTTTSDTIDALEGLLGLLDLLDARDDFPPEIRQAMWASHRVVAAKAALAKARSGQVPA